MHDFVVVGAGPPGSRFAAQAAASGHDVLVLDRGEPGPPLACSGHVSTDVWSYVPEGHRDALFQNAIYGARFHAGGPETRGHRFYKREPVSNAINRVGLDRALAEAAVDAGATLRTDHTVTDVRTDADGVTVVVRTPDDVVEVEGRMVVGCDGPHSRVRQTLDLPDPDVFLHGVLGFSDERDASDFVDVHLEVDGFFSWRIPRGEAGVEYGLAAPPGDLDAGERLDGLAHAYGTTIERRCSGVIPIGPPATVTADRAFLVGDAAGQTKPFTGGGILYGMRAADHAAAVVDPDDPASLDIYERTWRDDLGRDITLGKLIRRCYSLPTPVQRLGLRLTSGEVGVHMDRPTSVFSREHLRRWLPGS